MPSLIKKLDKIMDTIEIYCIGISTCLLGLVLLVNVILRNVFESGLPWANELSGYLNIFAVYIAVAAGFKYGDHVGVEAVVSIFKPNIRRHLDCIQNLLCIAFCGFVAVYSFKIAQNAFITDQVSSMLKIPMWIIYSFLLIGMIGSIIRLIMNIVKIYYKEEKGGSEQ